MRQQLEHTEDRYQVLMDDRVVQEEVQLMSPATRWYTHEQSLALYGDAGFADVRATIGFTFEPSVGDERLWTVFGRECGTHAGRPSHRRATSRYPVY